jgi:hypothetical protein
MMAALTIKDLRASRELDRKAMSSIQGGGAPWVFGWIRPYNPSSGSFGTVINYYQINNYADQMVNQFQNVEVNNSAPNSNISVGLDQNGGNKKQV